MATAKSTPTADTEALQHRLDYLRLSFVAEHLDDFAKLSAEQHWDHITFLAHLIEGEAQRRQDLLGAVSPGPSSGAAPALDLFELQRGTVVLAGYSTLLYWGIG